MTTLIPKYDQGATGAANRPINLKLAESVSVKDFGAVGDGSTDDTAAFLAAIASLNSTQRTIYMPPGIYKITSPLVFSIETTLYGTNPVGTYINYYGSGSAITTTATGSPNLAHVYLSGFGLNNLGTGTTGINFANVQDSIISNVTISGFTLYGIYAENSYGNLFEHINSSNTYGIYLGHEANNITLLQCTFLVNTDAGVFVGGGRANNIIGCDFESNPYGVQISGAAGSIGTKSLTIQGCYFEANTLYEILIQKHTPTAGIPNSIVIQNNYFCGISGKAPTAIGVVDVSTLDVLDNNFDNQGVAYTNSLTVSGTGSADNINWGFNRDTSTNGPSFIGTTKNNIAQSTATAWATFNGISGAVISESYNISSITRNSSGSYTVVMNKPINTIYCVLVNAENFGAYGNPMIAAATVTNSTTFNIYTATVATNNVDARTISFAVFG